MIVPNHAGGNVPRFASAPSSKREHQLHQIVGSVNYHTGSDVNDFLHGWLNYPIEHHLWPDLSLAQYRRAQPRLRALCERHGVPYAKSVFIRAGKMVANVVGDTRMPTLDALSVR